MGKGSVREGYRARLPRHISTHRFQYVWIRRPIFEELPLDPNECSPEGRVKMEAARGEACASQTVSVLDRSHPQKLVYSSGVVHMRKNVDLGGPLI